MTQEYTLRAPIDGEVITRNLTPGAEVVGQYSQGNAIELFTIGELDSVWVLADVFEMDLGRVKKGSRANVRVVTYPTRMFEGAVDYVSGQLDPNTRTAKVRIPVANPDLALRPGQSADVTISVDLGERLVVPKEAVLYTGTRRLVFVDLGEGRLRPQEITVGARGDDDYEVAKGLKDGDVVVTSGNFLIAAESRIRSAEQFWGRGGDGAD